MATAVDEVTTIDTNEEPWKVTLGSAQVTDTTMAKWTLAVTDANGKAVEGTVGTAARFLGVAAQNYDSAETRDPTRATKLGLLTLLRANGKMAASEAAAKSSRCFLVKGSGTNDAIVQADLNKPVYVTDGFTLEVAPSDVTAPIAGKIISVTTVGTDGDGQCELLIDASYGDPPAPLTLAQFSQQTIDMSDAAVTLVRTGTGTKLTGTVLYVDPNSAGASENLLLPPEADCNYVTLFVHNTGGEDIVVQNDAASTIDVVPSGRTGVFSCNGTAWYGGVTQESYIDVESFATGTAGVKVADNLANAWEIKEGSNSYLKIVTTDSAEAVEIGKALTMGAKINLYPIGSAAAAASGILAGVGTTAAPATSGVADAKFIELRCSSTAAEASDARGIYCRFALDGEHASAGGESIRGLTMVNENLGTAHGAHFGLGFGAEAGGSETSGLGAALRATLQIPNIASWAPTGTYAAGYFELYSDGSDSDPAGMTMLSVLSLGNNGDATGAADVDDDAYIIDLPGWTAAAGTDHAISSTSLAELPASSIGLRIRFNGNVYYVPAVIAAEWN